MQLFNSTNDYSISAKSYGAIQQVLHWLTVLLVALAWVIGTFDDVLPKVGSRDSGLLVHISAGIVILVLVAARVTWRLVDPPPTPEATEFGAWMGKWLDPAARIAHFTLYVLLVAVPVAGVVLQFARGDALPLFGLADIPSPWVEDRAFVHSVKEVHEILAHALIALAAFHAAAALIHHWVFRDRTLIRMLPHSRK